MFSYDETPLLITPRAPMFQPTLKNNALGKKIQSALNLGPSQRTLIFFQSALIWDILTHFEKKQTNRKSNFTWLALFVLFKDFKYNFENVSISSNVLFTILAIVRSFVLDLKK